MLQAVTLHRQGDAKDALALASELVKDKKGKEKASVVDPDFLLLGSWVLGQNGQGTFGTVYTCLKARLL